MTITISLAWWHIPTACTVAGIARLYWTDSNPFDGLFEAFVIMFGIAVVWAISGALK